MGRTSRNRKKKKMKNRILSLSTEDSFFNFVKWLLSEGWRPACKLKMSSFPETERGLMAKERIAPNTVIVRIPAHLLISVKCVSESLLGHILKECDAYFSVQQVLALFLIWEKHIGMHSFWRLYISTLPQKYTSPLFANERDLDKLPNFIKERISELRSGVEKLYKSVPNFIGGKICHHCKKYLFNIFTPDEFKWAWFTVNSRSVYISPEKNFPHDLKLTDANSLILAPFLDMFNHSDDAKVIASFNSNSNNYEIVSLVKYNCYDEVFVNYGDHSNLKLYLEYGFVLNENKNDIIFFNKCDFNVETFACTIDDYTKKFNYLITKNFFRDLYCTSEGFSWNMYVLCYVFSPSFAFNEIATKKIYSGTFDTNDWNNISKLGKILLKNKLIEYQQYFYELDKYVNENNCNESILIGCYLLKAYIDILKDCLVKFDSQCKI
uniref:SET domain-containing protein n=1 Tax=Panstrongylus megistus TaxID=65343 RepID=A0A069DUC3_9HEMI